MKLSANLKSSLCALFEVHADEDGVQRIVTPMQYSGSNDNVVIRVRPMATGIQIDEAGDAAMYAALAGGNTESERLTRWAKTLEETSPVRIDADEVLLATTAESRLVPAYIFRVAEAAQQFYALATARAPRRENVLKTRLEMSIRRACEASLVQFESNASLPIAGDFVADYLIHGDQPLIVIAASGVQRLLEAELIHMQYQTEKREGLIIAVVDSQQSVGAKQFERANYYTTKTLAYNERYFESLISSHLH